MTETCNEPHPAFGQIDTLERCRHPLPCPYHHRPIILDLCGGTGSWSAPYRAAGYDVRLVTLPDQDVRTYEPPPNVHGILAAPPCTMFSLARRTAKTPPDFDGAMETVAACLRIVWKCRTSGSLKWWAMENPVGLLRQFMGAPAFTFRHWQFGDHGNKPTDLWGYFDPPRRRFKKSEPIGRKTWGYRIKPPEGLTRQEARAITPPGFAAAFFKANP